MNWLTNFVRPKLRALVGREVPENLWDKCSKCEQMIFHRDLEDNLYVCRHCGHHMRLAAKKRLKMLFDQGEYQRLNVPGVFYDPLRFRDTKKYSDRLKEARQKTQEDDAVIVAKGTICGKPVVMVVFDFNFMGGSMGAAVGNGIVEAAEEALKLKAALIIVPASGGARMQEGIISLMQMPRTTVAVARVREAKLPYITILTDPTTGGVSASFAMLGDITIAEPGAMIGFAGARVIQQTIKQELPAVQKALDVLETLNFKPEEREAYEGRLKMWRIEANTIKKYEADGFEKGKIETAHAIALNFLNLGISIEKVSEATGLSSDVLKKLQND